MNLVHFLAAGVNGAASGSATFVLRGTASSAQAVMYNEFEGLTQPATNVVTLDANGAAEVYVDAYCDVEIKNSAGTTLRTVTVGNSDSTTEVQSTSFTGTDYDGSPANTVGEPITLRALLNKWITSAGSADWQVLIGGVATNLQAALAGVSGLIFNVKDPAYGATGDGVTDDTTAIIAANTAAAGAPVYFPPGTYKVSTAALSDANLNWFGAGIGASIISGTTGTQLISLTNNTNTGWKNFHGLSFTSSGAYDRLFLLEESQNVTFSQCSFDASLCTADVANAGATAGLSKFLFTDCDFTLGASTARGLYNNAASGNRKFTLRGCGFTVPSGFTGSILVGADFLAEACRFDGSLVTSGVYAHVDAEDQTVAGRYIGVFNGNTFSDGGSDGFAFALSGVTTSSRFSEGSNIFAGFADPVDVTDPGHIYDYSNAASYDVSNQIILGSRQGKQLNFDYSAGDGDLLDMECFLVAERIVIDLTFAGNLIVYQSPAEKPIGLDYQIIVLNNSGASRDISIGGSGSTQGQNTVLDGGRFVGLVTTYQETVGASCADHVASSKGGA